MDREQHHVVSRERRPHRDRQARMLLGDGLDHAGERLDRLRRHGRDLDATDPQAGHLVDARPRGGEASHDLAGRGDQRFARVREHQLPAHPAEQVEAQIAFERANGLRQRRLGNVQGGRRLVHAAVVDDGEEVAQLADVHQDLALRWASTASTRR